MAGIDQVLEERGSRYGEFKNHAEIAQSLKNQIHFYDGWHKLTPDMREALEMICHKMARILNGDPNYADSWTDIAGYATLVEKRLLSEG